MSNFKHENIVCLIGICFDSESISLIMEHMEAGDLLSYLRAARPSSKVSREVQFEVNLTLTHMTFMLSRMLCLVCSCRSCFRCAWM